MTSSYHLNWSVIPCQYVCILQPMAICVPSKLSSKDNAAIQEVQHSPIEENVNPQIEEKDAEKLNDIKQECCNDTKLNNIISNNKESHETKQWEDWMELNVKEETDIRDKGVDLGDDVICENFEECSEIFIKQEMEYNGIEENSTEASNLEHEPLNQCAQISVSSRQIHCDRCLYECDSKGELEKHICKQQRKFYQCECCLYKTVWKSNLTKHIVSRHTALEEINWFKCEHCSYKGKTREYLKWHVLHCHNISVKWYNCPQCSFKAKTRPLLQRHVVRYHTNSEQIKWFTCDHCSYKGKFKTNLRQHIISKHLDSNNIKWFQCDKCPFKAKRKRNLKYHQINKHTDYDKIMWFQCEFCILKFKRKSNLTAHVSLHHSTTESRNRTVRPATREIPVFIENKLCWKRVLADKSSPKECLLKSIPCRVKDRSTLMHEHHMLKSHTVKQIKEEKDLIITT